jgi:Rrf2 family protein
VSTNTQFALGVHMLTLLAGSAPQSLSSDELAGSANANPAHVRRVLGRFRAAGLVGSKSGVGGGSHLAVDPARLTLADVWRVVHGEAPILGLHEAAPECPVGQSIQSILVDIDRDARSVLEAELETLTIAQLVGRAAAGANIRSLR